MKSKEKPRCNKCGKILMRYNPKNKLCTRCYQLSKTKEKKNYFLLLAVIFIIFTLLPICSAQQIFKQNDVIDLKIQCIINGTFCSSTAFCNATISNPNGSLLVNNLGMTNQNSFYNITLPSSDVLGDYLCSATCCDVGFCGTGTDCDFSITPSGFNLTGGQSSLYIIALIIAIGTFCLLLFASFKIPFKNRRNEENKVISINHLKWFKIGAMSMSYMVLMFIFALSMGIFNNFLYVIGVGKMFEWIYDILLAGVYPIIILAIVLGFAIFIADINAKKKLTRRHYR